MLGRTHQIIGLFVGVGTYLALAPSGYQPATAATVLVMSHLLALLPDIDQPLSDFWHSVPAGRIFGKIPPMFLQHRNLTHSLLGCLLVYLGLTKLGHIAPEEWGLNIALIKIVGMAAYISHLVADMVTVEGIPLLFPIQHMFGIPPRPFQGIRIQTGHWFENLIVFPAVNLLFIALVIGHWSQIHILLTGR
jgi:membrane-bound metal-dependent hydrolase YbcI (DUF457 family)